MLVWATVVAIEVLESAALLEPSGSGMVLVDVTMSEWQRWRIAEMMMRGKQAEKDGKALEKAWGKKAKEQANG